MERRHPQAPSRPLDNLVMALDDALELLDEFSGAGVAVPALAENPDSLLAQCLALCAQREQLKPEPVRTVHQFACTGGTLICKCIAAMPNTQVLSEVDPLSSVQRSASRDHRFAPTDMVTLMRQSTRGARSELIVELFLGNLRAIHQESVRLGQRLILRDHAHSQFCVGPDIPDRPGLRAIVQSAFPTLSVVTVRHPLDSYLSLQANGWVVFSPASFDEYCGRYIAFLRAHEGVPVFRYEDFVSDPRQTMRRICDSLEIPFLDQFTELFGVFRMTGDSGRRGDVIEFRPRRPVDAPLAEESRASANFHQLRAILGYDE